ncbi:hypothetical protein GCM10027059_21740 [Myceligenerans halotolerans]
MIDRSKRTAPAVGLNLTVRWPKPDLAGKRSGKGYYQGAAVCRRGHVETDCLELEPEPEAVRSAVVHNCSRCGATILTACRECGQRIRGRWSNPLAVACTSYSLPSFCDGCGAAFPWVTRVERIYELENLLEQEDILEADRAVIQNHLARLRADSLSVRDEEKLWKAVTARLAGKVLSGPVLRIVEGVAGAAVRAQLNL